MIIIKAPCTTANLGPGFDILGLALSIYNTLTVEESEDFIFNGFPDKFSNKENLVYKSYKTFFEVTDSKIIPVSFSQDTKIPIARGLGSSSACIVAGLEAANAISKKSLSKDDILFIANDIEGHPDNVAPCIFGGLVSAKKIDNSMFYQRWPISDLVKIVIAYPCFELKTSLARSILPKTIDFKDSIKTSSNLLVLLDGLKTGNSAMIEYGIDDVLHVPYRKKLIDEYDDIEKIMKQNGSCGVTISGAGSSILSLFTSSVDLDVIQKKVSSLKNNWTVQELQIDYSGSSVEEV